MRTFAVGDIHGCSVALRALIGSLDLQQTDRIIFLGDYIDRGPDSFGVIEYLCELSSRCNAFFLRGNHEVILQEYQAGRIDMASWSLAGGKETLDSYGGQLDTLPPNHQRFLNSTQLWLENETHIFVHANYDQALPMESQPEHSLLWEHLSERLPGPHFSGKKVICGHTPQLNGRILNRGHQVCIDTYCFGGGWLTAFETTSENVFQANQLGKVRSGVSLWKRFFVRGSKK